jgi:CheY-like chemotaxis protein
VIVSPSPDDQSTGSERVRFTFETRSLRQAVEVADQLRRVNPTGVRVRPGRLKRLGSYNWVILVTTPPLETSGIAALEEEMRWVARRAPGVRLTGWLFLSGPGDSARPTLPSEGRRERMRVLIVDDSGPFRGAARRLLARRGYQVDGEADSAAAGFNAVERLKPDAVLLDVRLPDGSGLDLCALLTRDDDAPAVLLVSGHGYLDSAQAKTRGARDLVAKTELAHVDLDRVWA